MPHHYIPFYNLSIGTGLIFAILLLEADFHRRGDLHRFPVFLLSLILAFLFGWLTSHFADYVQRGFFQSGVGPDKHSQYGFSFYGGLLGAAIFLLPALKIQRFHLGRSLDRLAPIVPLVHGFGRIGCSFMGCCYGRIVDIAGWSFQFPTQIISATFLITLFLVLIRRQFRINRIYIYFWAYSVFRFLIEFLRGDERGKLFTGLLSPAQETSLLILLVTIVTWLVLNRQGKGPGTAYDVRSNDKIIRIRDSE